MPVVRVIRLRLTFSLPAAADVDQIGDVKVLPIIAAFVLAALFFPLTVIGAGKKKSPTPASDTSDRISAVHLTSITLSIYANHQSKEYKVTPATRITVNGQPSQLSGLATGMDVVVTAPDGITAAVIDAKTPRH